MSPWIIPIVIMIIGIGFFSYVFPNTKNDAIKINKKTDILEFFRGRK